MRRVVIVTDYNCDIPSELLKDNIRILPLDVVMGNGERYPLDKVNRKLFCQYLNLGTRVSEVNLDWNQATDILSEIEDGTDVIVISSSFRINPNMELALEELLAIYRASHINSRVCLVDSNTTSMALGLLVLDVAEMAEDGVDFERLIEYARGNRSKYCCEFLSNNNDILLAHKVISSRKLQLANKKGCQYIYGLTIRGLIRPLTFVENDKAELALLQRLYNSYVEKYVLISSELDNRKHDMAEIIEEESIKIPTIINLSGGNLFQMGANVVGLCYKKK